MANSLLKTAHGNKHPCTEFQLPAQFILLNKHRYVLLPSLPISLVTCHSTRSHHLIDGLVYTPSQHSENRNSAGAVLIAEKPLILTARYLKKCALD